MGILGAIGGLAKKGLKKAGGQIKKKYKEAHPDKSPIMSIRSPGTESLPPVKTNRPSLDNQSSNKLRGIRETRRY